MLCSRASEVWTWSSILSDIQQLANRLGCSPGRLKHTNVVLTLAAHTRAKRLEEATSRASVRMNRNNVDGLVLPGQHLLPLAESVDSAFTRRTCAASASHAALIAFSMLLGGT